MMLSEEELRTHYLEGFLKLPPDCSHKTFKLALTDGKFLRLRKRVRDVASLRKQLLQLESKGRLSIGCIKAIYWGTLSWSDPAKITTLALKKGYAVADRLIIKDVLPFDIDGDGSVEGLEWARQEAVKLLKWLRKENLKPLWISFSNAKGFHIPCEGPKLPADAKKRLESVRKYRKVYYSKLLNENITVCKQTFLDPARILKIIGCPDPHTGITSTQLTPEQLRTPFPELFKFINVTGDSSRIKPEKLVSTIKKQKELEKRVQTFMTDKVIHTKNRAITILKYPSRMPITKLKSLTERLAKTYKGTWHAFNTPRHYFLINTTAHTPKRLQKIKNASKSLNSKNKTCYFPVSPERNLKGKITEKTPKHTFTIKGLSTVTSTAHDKFLKKMYGIPEHNKNCGDSTLKLTRTNLTR